MRIHAEVRTSARPGEHRFGYLVRVAAIGAPGGLRFGYDGGVIGGAAFLYRAIPETKGKPLEQIERDFE
jgi:hypothetical protein